MTKAVIDGLFTAGLTDKAVIECCAMNEKMSWMMGDGEIAQKAVRFTLIVFTDGCPVRQHTHGYDSRDSTQIYCVLADS